MRLHHDLIVSRPTPVIAAICPKLAPPSRSVMIFRCTRGSMAFSPSFHPCVLARGVNRTRRVAFTGSGVLPRSRRRQVGGDNPGASPASLTIQKESSMLVASWFWSSMAFLLSLEGDPASRFAPPHGSLLRARPASSHARCQTFLGPGLTSGPWGDPSRVSGPRCR